MEYEQIYSQFENACVQAQNPQTRIQGEQFLLNFRKSPKAIPVARYILDRTNNAFAQFHASAAIKECAVREYDLHTKEEIYEWKAYLLNYVLSKPSSQLPHFVREQLLSTVAVVVKRGWIDMPTEEKHSILNKVSELLNDNSTPNSKIIALSLLSAFLDEFSSSKASAVGLSWDFHYQCKKSWEKDYLMSCFTLLAQVIDASIQGNNLQTLKQHPENYQTLLIALHACDKILAWQFTPQNENGMIAGSFQRSRFNESKDDIGSSTNNFVISNVFPPHWHDALVRPDILNTFFKLYTFFYSSSRNDMDEPTVMHRIRQCLIQFAGLYGKIFVSDAERKGYLECYVTGLGELIQGALATTPTADNADNYGKTLSGLSQILHRLFYSFKITDFVALPLFESFLQCISTFTITAMNRTVSTLSDGLEEVEDTWIMDAVQELLDMWACIVSQMHPTVPIPESTRNQLMQTAYTIFATYVTMRMELCKESTDDDDEDEDDAGIKDYDQFEDELYFISAIGRSCLAPCIEVLIKEFSARLEQMRRVVSGAESVMNSKLHGLLHEQLHWLLIIIGFVMTESGHGEKPLIPPECLALSRQAASIEQDIVINLCNKVVDFYGVISGVDRSKSWLCSPLVGETCAWVLERWVKSYLYPDTNDYLRGYMSPRILEVYGKGTNNGQQVLFFIITNLQKNFLLWNGEKDLLAQQVELLHALSTNRDIETDILGSSMFPEMITYFMNNLATLPESVHEPLIMTCTTLASNAPKEEVKRQMLEGIMEGIRSRFMAVVKRPGFEKDFQSPGVISQVLSCFEMFSGLALATTSQTANIFFNFFQPFLEDFIKLFGLYRQFFEVEIFILEFFGSLVEHEKFEYLTAPQRNTLYMAVLALLKQHESNNVGRKRVPQKNNSEELDLFNDLRVFLNILGELMAVIGPDVDIVDLSDAEKTTVAEVVVYGVNSVVPSISKTMLEYPPICRSYITVVSRLIQYLPDKLTSLPGPFLESLLKSLEFGIESPIYDVAMDSFDAMAALARWVAKQPPSTVTFYTATLTHLLQVVLHLLLFKEFDSDLLEPAGEALLDLILASQSSYQSIITQFISTQPDAFIKSRLEHGFGILNETITTILGNEPEQRSKLSDGSGSQLMGKVSWIQWENGLTKFLSSVRGVLRVK